MKPAAIYLLDDGGDGGGRWVEVPVERLGWSLTDLLAAAGVPLDARCGQRGVCRGCLVELREGCLEGVERGVVRSCQARVVSGERVVVAVPRRARIGMAPQVGETFVVDVPYALDPAFPLQAGRDLALAVDLGTTTVVAMVVDLRDGRVLAGAGGYNAQIRYGDNVLTRIGAASDPAVREAMRRVVVDGTLEPLARKAMARAGRSMAELAGVMVAGNTTMLHLLAGEDPASLGVAPFRAVFLESRELALDSLGGRFEGVDGSLPVRLLPGLAAYVGADIAAGVHATGMEYDEAPALLVDLGTNGEIVLQSGGRLFGCATAAGPAFEGAGLTSGGRAHAGAVERIRIGTDPFQLDLGFIGGGGAGEGGVICGSAYVDFLALGRRCGLLLENGRFHRGFWQGVPEALREQTEEGLALKLWAGDGAPRISEVDVALLLQAKAAVGAGIETLLELGGIAAGGLGRVYLAGGFGMHIDVGHAVAMGLLPGVDPGRVRVVGNAALAGAVVAALDRTACGQMEALRARTEVVELNLAAGFEDRYIDHLGLLDATP